MEYILYAVFLVGGFFIGFWLRKQHISTKLKTAQAKADKILNETKSKQSELLLKAQEKALRIIDDAKVEEKKRRQEIGNLQSRLEKRENTFSQKLLELQDKQQKLYDKIGKVEEVKEKILDIKKDQITKLEKIAQMSKEEAHKFFAVDLNNRVWGYLEKSDRTETEDNEMIWSAYASLYHWSIIGEPVNIQRGEWMISHVWAILGKPESAVYHAERCWKLTEERGLVDFDLGYAHEALARAYACAGDKKKALNEYSRAEEVGKAIKGKEDAKMFLGDLEKGHWFGIR